MFEGPEKKLEIMTRAPFPSLRTLGADFWERIVEQAKANIISTACTDACDAYLLSESSLFVCDRRVVMITCGRTTLIESALALIDRIPAPHIEALIYERKNENFPELQHTTFRDDTARLREKSPGSAVLFGDPKADHIALFHFDRDFDPEPDDATLEVLMYGIEPRISGLFSQGASAAELRRRIGFDDMLPGFLVDDHLFDPIGYSFNAVMGEFYSTLHVTPQRKGSYTSFETNYGLDGQGVEETVSRLLDFFAPERADVLLFQHRLDPGSFEGRFQVTSAQSSRLGCGYTVDYAHVEREVARRHGSRS